MFNSPNDQNIVEAAMHVYNAHPEEIDRVATLGALPEIVGQEIVDAVTSLQNSAWYIPDMTDTTFTVLNINSPDALGMEARAASGIGRVHASQYTHLCVGCTIVDAPLDADVVHVNVTPEDMRFKAKGPRILIHGEVIPLPTEFFRSAEGAHIPFDATTTPALIGELFRTVRPGGDLRFSSSTNSNDTANLMRQAGFHNVTYAGPERRTLYQQRMTLPTLVIRASRK